MYTHTHTPLLLGACSHLDAPTYVHIHVLSRGPGPSCPRRCPLGSLIQIHTLLPKSKQTAPSAQACTAGKGARPISVFVFPGPDVCRTFLRPRSPASPQETLRRPKQQPSPGLRSHCPGSGASLATGHPCWCSKDGGPRPTRPSRSVFSCSPRGSPLSLTPTVGEARPRRQRPALCPRSQSERVSVTVCEDACPRLGEGEHKPQGRGSQGSKPTPRACGHGRVWSAFSQ